MSGLLLDSSAYFHLQKGHLDASVAVRKADRIALSPVVLGELLDAFRMGRDRRQNERFLGEFLAAFGAPRS